MSKSYKLIFVCKASQFNKEMKFDFIERHLLFLVDMFERIDKGVILLINEADKSTDYYKKRLIDIIDNYPKER